VPRRGRSSGGDSTGGPLPLFPEPFLERDVRFPAELAADARGVGVRAALVTANRWMACDVERTAGDGLEERDRLVHRRLDRPADVVRAAPGLHRADRRVDDVGDVCPPARLVSVAVE